MPKQPYRRRTTTTRPVKLDMSVPLAPPEPPVPTPWVPTMGEVLKIQDALKEATHCWEMWADDLPGERFWETRFRKAVHELVALVPKPDPEDDE